MTEYDLPEEIPEESAPGWIVTFADLLSLLMTFFVLLLSFSTLELMKFKSMAGSVRHSLGVKPELSLSNTPMGESLLPYQDAKEGKGGRQDREDAEIRADLERLQQSPELKGRAVVRQTPRGVSLHIQGDMMFDSGSAELTPDAFRALDLLAAYSKRLDHFIDIQGHSDSVPISTSLYPSNWELSAARAGRAVRYLSEAGVPAERLRAIGLADTQPVDVNDTAEGRLNNRRVEFIFVRRITEPPPEPEVNPAAERGSAPPAEPNGSSTQ